MDSMLKRVGLYLKSPKYYRMQPFFSQ